MIGIEYVDAGIFMVTNTLSSTLFYEIIGPTRMELDVDVLRSAKDVVVQEQT